MASVKNSDIKEIFAFMGDFWNFVKEFWIPENEGAYWEQVSQKSIELNEKYHGNRFCQIMLLAYTDYLEEKQTGKNLYQRRNERNGNQSGRNY